MREAKEQQRAIREKKRVKLQPKPYLLTVFCRAKVWEGKGEKRKKEEKDNIEAREQRKTEGWKIELEGE